MKLVNINVGIKIDNSEKIGNFLKYYNADIIALQEVVRHLDDSVFDEYQLDSTWSCHVPMKGKCENRRFSSTI